MSAPLSHTHTHTLSLSLPLSALVAVLVIAAEPTLLSSSIPCPRAVDINAQDVLGWSPLHEAAARGHLRAALTLLSQGADSSLRTVDGEVSLCGLLSLSLW